MLSIVTKRIELDFKLGNLGILTGGVMLSITNSSKERCVSSHYHIPGALSFLRKTYLSQAPNPEAGFQFGKIYTTFSK
jgi:hypothetical protein